MIEMTTQKINFNDLKKPFKKIHWRPKTIIGDKILLLAYLDSRDVMKRLDDVCGAENWQCDFKTVKDVVYAGIGINTVSGWVWKWDCGIESNQDKEKGESSDAFKRAGVKWGIGRYLYYLKKVYVQCSQTGQCSYKTKDGKWLKYDEPKETDLPEWARYKE